MACKTVATIIAYIPLGASLPGAVRRVMELGGRIKSVNEELRRIVARAPLPEAHRIRIDLERMGVPPTSMSFEVNAVCQGVQKWEPPRGFAKSRGRGRLIAAGVCAGRIVFAELKDGMLLVKIGRATRLSRITSLPGPGDLSLRELPGMDDVERAVECVLGGEQG